MASSRVDARKPVPDPYRSIRLMGAGQRIAAAVRARLRGRMAFEITPEQPWRALDGATRIRSNIIARRVLEPPGR